MIDPVLIDESKQITRFIRLHPAFALLPEVALHRIASTATLQKHARDSRLSIPKGCFGLVGFGLIKSSVQIARRGVEFIVSLAGPGEAIELFSSPRALEHKVVTASAIVVFVKAAAVSSELPPAVLALATECAKAQHRATERLLAAVHATAESCVARALIDLQSRFGDEREDGSAFVPGLQFTRAELAALAGTSTETTIRTLTAWQRAGLVTISGVVKNDGGGIEIHRLAELQALAVAL